MSVIIRLQNLPISANASNIRRFFVGLAIPEGGVHIVGGNDGDAFIAFATDEDARKAMLLDRQTINGTPVRLFLSSKTEMQSVIESARSSALFTSVVTTASLPPVPQKTEAMQALDVTSATLPSSFSSYRNGATRDSYPEKQNEQFSYPGKRPSPPLPNRPFEPPPSDPYVVNATRMPTRLLSDRPNASESLPSQREYDYNQQQRSQFSRYDGPRDRAPVPDYPPPPVDHSVPTNPPLDPYRSYYEEPIYDRRMPDARYTAAHVTDSSRDEPRGTFGDSRYNRVDPDNRSDYEKLHVSPIALPERNSRENFSQKFEHPRMDHPAPYPPYAPPERHRPTSVYDREPPVLPDLRTHVERDFSVRPPWLNEENAPPGVKRPLQPPPDFDEYGARKKRAPPPTVKAPVEVSPLETEFVVRLALPISEVGVKSVFEILRGVHIVPKWGIRIEEDALQRPTGYIFIMLTARESFDRALSYDGCSNKGKDVKVVASSLEEFYRVSDSTFRQKCPPEILKKLPASGQPSSPPHHADGCLEITEVPPDATRLEIVRFLGAPGLTAKDVIIAGFAPSDKIASQSSKSVRALVVLPSAKDIEILLSAKARPLRPDGSFPPVRLTPISRLQYEAFSAFGADNKPSSEPPKTDKPAQPASESNEQNKASNSEPLTCAFLSGLSRYLKDSEVLRLFSSVLIPGDAIRMVPPANTSAYIDFISENNCRRAISDITGAESKAKLAHPQIQIEPISRGEMENRLGNVSKVEEPQAPERPTRPPPPPMHQPPPPAAPIRDARSWDSRPGPRIDRHDSPVPFRPRSPPPGRPSYDEQPYYDRTIPPIPFEDGPLDPYAGPRRPRPPIGLPHPGLPPPLSDYHPPRPVEHQQLPPPGRRPTLDYVTVFVGNLPPAFTVDQLAGMLRDYYFVPGSVRIRRDVHGVPTGEALVDFNSSYDADRVIQDLNGYRIAGRPIVLQYDRRA